MKKPTVYLDTTIISAEWYDGADVIGLARRLRTRDWWETARPSFSTGISNVTEAELRIERDEVFILRVRGPGQAPLDPEDII